MCAADPFPPEHVACRAEFHHEGIRTASSTAQAERAWDKIKETAMIVGADRIDVAIRIDRDVVDPFEAALVDRLRPVPSALGVGE